MYRFLITALGFYAGSLAILSTAGGAPPIPWLFLVAVGLFFVPFSYAVVEGLPHAARSLERFLRFPSLVWTVLSATVLGSLMAIGKHPVIALPLTVFCLVHLVLRRRSDIQALLVACIALLLIYGSVWNVNYLVGMLTLNRLHDPQALAWDLNSYSSLTGTPIDPVGMFPLLRWTPLFHLMETAYFLLFSEIFVVVLVLIRRQISLVPFFSVTLMAYMASAAVYCFYPVVGPCIYFPETFAVEFRGSQTFQLMQSMQTSFQAIASNEAGGGYTYFVALPSMHVVMAIIMQRFLIVSRPVFYVFLPGNILMALSTVFLGYHYFVDLTGGVLLAVVVLAAASWRERASPAAVKSTQAKSQQRGALLYR